MENIIQAFVKSSVQKIIFKYRGKYNLQPKYILCRLPYNDSLTGLHMLAPASSYRCFHVNATAKTIIVLVSTLNQAHRLNGINDIGGEC